MKSDAKSSIIIHFSSNSHHVTVLTKYQLLVDVALQIVKDRPELAVSERSLLGVLARNSGAFRKQYNLIQRIGKNLYSPIGFSW